MQNSVGNVEYILVAVPICFPIDRAREKPSLVRTDIASGISFTSRIITACFLS